MKTWQCPNCEVYCGGKVCKNCGHHKSYKEEFMQHIGNVIFWVVFLIGVIVFFS